jgi:prophage maintenance system killer protein
MKEEVEQLLNCQISDEQFQEALEHAKMKQDYLFRREHRAEIKAHWYLVELTKEYVISLDFSHFTMDLCKRLAIEKEYHAKSESTPTNTSIIQAFA